MKPAYMEHANMTVPDIEEAMAFLKTIEPEFSIRHDGRSVGGHRWVHFGSPFSYVALREPHLDNPNPQAPVTPYKNYGVNHLAWIVEDLDSVILRLDEKGYEQTLKDFDSPYRKRVYYNDRSGFEWEIIQYTTTDRALMNSYQDAGVPEWAPTGANECFQSVELGPRGAGKRVA